MNEFRKNIFAMVTAVVIIVLTLLLGMLTINRLFEGEPETIEINSRIVFEKITDQYFVVTRTIYADEEATINIDQGSSWSNFFWGQEIDAKGLVRLDLGVDLENLEEDDIVIDDQAKIITLYVPDASILDANIQGDIEVESSQGIFRTLFRNDPNGDYNRARQKLIDEASEAILEDQDILNDARNSSIKLLQIILGETGYSIQIEDFEEKAVE